MSHRLALYLAAGTLSALSVTAQQASIVLERADVVLCQNNETAWTIAKALNGPSTVTGPASVSWTVTATRGATSANELAVNGFLRVRNGGSAPATIGNIVINLQRQRQIGGQMRWVSASADVANATQGDAATSANIASAASQENGSWNAQWNSPSTYAVSGQRGTFTENGGSGPIEFTDADSNTIWSLVPQQQIPGGQSVDLLYTATFNNSVLQIPTGTSVRAEVIVTFGNSGTRGGGGASAQNIDINGNGVLDADEARVRSVPDRQTRSVPALEACNDVVTVVDDGLSSTGTATYSNFNDGGLGAPGVSVNATTSWTVSADVDGGATGGDVCNSASLSSPGSSVQLVKSYDPVTGQPNDWYTFVCCPGLSESSGACVTVNAAPGFDDGDYCTYSQGGFGGPGAPYNLLAANFAAIWGAPGIEVGIPGATGFSARWTSATAVQNYLPAGGGSNKFSADLVNPTSTSAGVFGGQVLTLGINIALSDADAAFPSPFAFTGYFGDLYYCNPGNSLHGLKIRQIYAVMMDAIGGLTPLPAGYSYSGLNGLANSLNSQAFQGCIVGPFATQFLSRTACP